MPKLKDVLMLSIAAFAFLGVLASEKLTTTVPEVIRPQVLTTYVYEDFISTKEESIKAINYLNQIRAENGKKPIEFDERLYNLAVARSKDMFLNKYLDHTSPTGECAYTMQTDFGIPRSYTIAENALGYDYDPNCKNCEIKTRPMTDAIDKWMTSRGHRYNLLYDKHIAGAVGCYKSKCVFLGRHTDPYGLGGGGGCYTAEEGRRFWRSTPSQPGEK